MSKDGNGQGVKALEKCICSNFPNIRVRGMKDSSHALEMTIQNTSFYLSGPMNWSRRTVLKEKQNLLTVDLENDLISEKKRVTISGTIPKNDEWNNKSDNINSQIMDMFKKPNIDFIVNSIFNPKKHLNISKQHLNK